MKFSSLFASSAVLASAYAAYVPSDPWTHLTPHAPAPTGAITDHNVDFGIQIVTVEANVTAALRKHKRDVINQIGDGQIQHQTSHSLSSSLSVKPTTVSAASQISDGQIQASGIPSATPKSDNKFPLACSTKESLKMRLKGGILTDSLGRIGAIVANRQFQFDGPPPQAGSIYAAGWSITKDGFLALGNQTEFYECRSGEFYNLYDENIAPQCSGVKFSIIDLVQC